MKKITLESSVSFHSHAELLVCIRHVDVLHDKNLRLPDHWVQQKALSPSLLRSHYIFVLLSLLIFQHVCLHRTCYMLFLLRLLTTHNTPPKALVRFHRPASGNKFHVSDAFNNTSPHGQQVSHTPFNPSLHLALVSVLPVPLPSAVYISPFPTPLPTVRPSRSCAFGD